MRRVISVLLILMQLLFFLNYLINGSIMQLNLYLWIFTALFGALVSYRLWSNAPHMHESEKLYMTMRISLSVVSTASIIFILMLVIARPYLL